MNPTDLHILLHSPESITPADTLGLEAIVQEFPYFQSARAIWLKGLFDQKSYKYNAALKKAAAHTTDRDLLFEFITSDRFVTYKALDFTIDTPEEKPVVNSLISSLLSSITQTQDKQEIAVKPEAIAPLETQQQLLEEKLKVGQPLPFAEDEKFSFQEWLQLAKTRPIQRKNDQEEAIIDREKQKKIDLIDKFIESNPKIVTVKNTTTTPVNVELSERDHSLLMTETLAKIYLEQKKYQKAIQAYEILILKYPEKSSFFADQIVDIKALQQYNN